MNKIVEDNSGIYGKLLDIEGKILLLGYCEAYLQYSNDHKD